ncbi:ligase [Aeromonas allosaccharophila]|uniref:O-antigen ligase family protein n=1 Tax=Aeromonas allosaccharophila TaxID=656 RepID=UPI0005B21E89|nr:O-antigen ligase family protein [Aeromonas allosaccharophila]OKP42010.1 ligase [Aeromonas allosaccharophila]
MTPTHNIFLSWRDNATHNLVQVGAFLFGALSLAIPSGYSYGPAILLAVSLTVCWRPLYWLRMPKEVKMLALFFILYALVQGLSILLDNGSVREFDRPSRVIMATLILPLLVQNPVRPITISLGVAVGAFIAGIVSSYEKFYLGVDRAFENMMPIQGGDISMTLGVLSLCSYFWFKKNGSFIIAMFMLASCAMGMLGSFLSGTRGGWLLLPIILFTIVFHFKETLCKVDKMVFAILMLGMIGVVSIPQTNVLVRIDAARSDVVHFIKGDNKDTSLGIRFQLWYSALDSYLHKPFIGWGNNGIRQSQLEQLKSGKITQFIYDFDSHAHNQFLDEMSKRGTLGLVVILMMFLYPVLIYRRLTKINLITPIMLGVSVLCTIDYSLSQAFLNHNSGIIFFSMLTAILVTSAVSEQMMMDR